MTKRKGGNADSGRYDVYKDWLSEDEYLTFTRDIFLNFDKILKENKIVLYNFSYSIENPSLPYKIVNHIEQHTPFILVDTIIWKKKNGMPFPANKRRLSRNWEFVFVFCRKKEIDTFDVYKPITKINSKTKQAYYEVNYNFIEAKNNDGATKCNQATFSSELVCKLLSLYTNKGSVVYDPFMGTGTTAIGAIKNECYFVGSEISKNQVVFAENRIEEETRQLSFLIGC